MNAIIKMKTNFWLYTIRNAPRAFLLCGWITVAGLAPPVLSQNYSTPFTFTTIAGKAGSSGFADGTNSEARFAGPYALTLDSAGNLYGVDYDANTLRKATPVGTNWVVTTLAGKAGSSGFADGTNSEARFHGPAYLAMDRASNIYVGDFLNNTVRKVTPVGTNWVVTTLAGLAGHSGSADGTNSAARFNGPGGVALDGAGSVYVAEFNSHTIRKVTPVGTNWVVTTVAGKAGANGSADGTGSAARFYYPADVAIDSAGSIYVADDYNCAIRKLTAIGPSWVVTTLAGKAGDWRSVDGTNTAARFDGPNSVSVDSLGNAYVADSDSQTIRKLTPVGTNWVVTTVAGKAGAVGTIDGTGSAARFNFGSIGGTVVVDSAGNLYVPDYGNHTIRKGSPPLVMTSGPGFGFNRGQFDFTLTGPSGQSVVVESSTDLVNWLPLWTNNLTFPATLTFSDSLSGVDPNRFYRAFAR
jgi:hypothetical protein